MTSTPIQVKGVDQHGETVIDGTVSTLRNGFMELWLPRDRKISLTLRHSDMAAEGVVETFDSSPTCVTTFQLK